eukprot:1085954-Karenia_brevis.AAC.1
MRPERHRLPRRKLQKNLRQKGPRELSTVQIVTRKSLTPKKPSFVSIAEQPFPWSPSERQLVLQLR